jgi:energy-coupling factor transporter ATP-binding protein EcfA2/SOS-response transcriptional repressor LexA
MTRLTKSEIVRLLLSGGDVRWQDASGKDQHLTLNDAKQRRLCAYLLSSDVRQPTGLALAFVTGLSTVYEASDDPASTVADSPAGASGSGPWRLKSIETEGFGGLNSWGGGPFPFEFDGESLLLEGPNGSGKSSLVGAILWVLSGERPRDQAQAKAHDPQPVFAANDKQAGHWPPIASYPPSVADLQSPPSVRVQLTFKNSDGLTASVERRLAGGNITQVKDPAFEVPLVLIETGLLMPVRLTQLRLDEGRGRLTDAVQKLTGLDDLVAIGTLVDGLCHKSREYLSFKKSELAIGRQKFNEAVSKARIVLASIPVDVPSFVPKDTNDGNGPMAAFGKTLADRATELTQVISGELAEGLDLSNSNVQHQVIAAIAGAKEDVETGIEGLDIWKSLHSIAQAFDEEASERVKIAIASVRAKSEEAVRLLEKGVADSKFQLKALAAKWHSDHRTGAIENCPLCEHELTDTPSLVDELEALRAAGDAAARTFDDNLNAISTELEEATPVAIRRIGAELLKLEPRARVTEDLREAFILKDRYAKYLVRFGALVNSALSDTPPAGLAGSDVPTVLPDADVLKKVTERIIILERLLALAGWFGTNSSTWTAWWKTLAEPQAISPVESGGEKYPSGETPRRESLTDHISRLSDALITAEPYRVAANEMRTAWTVGLTAAEIEKEVTRRDEIADNLEPLKKLGSLCEAVAREAIIGLSGRISKILDRIHLTERLRFQSARLERKEGLVVRGEFGPELRIDATLVANTSWLRAVLWAFLFALREEAVEQLGTDPFPMLVFDDPQSTFDAQHRHMWARYVVSLQSRPSGAQLLLTTHDENFLKLIKVDGITGRQALISAPDADRKHVGIFEGEALDREWVKAQKEKTPQAGVLYMSTVRVYVEGMLKLMLRGEDSDISKLLLGSLRERLCQYHKAQRAPWNQSAFNSLIGALGPGRAEVKYIEGSHHTTGCNYGMGEATTVEQFWREQLKPALDRAHRTVREHRLVHGGLSALHAGPPAVALPEGYQAKVRAIPLRVLGRAAALTEGRAADGTVDMDQFAAPDEIPVILGNHFAYRLMAATLEPVARVGDIVLVQGHGEPSPKSLVVAISEEQILTRRFEIAENHTDIAVLTAQAINPRAIAPPVIAHKASFKLHKIIGVLYEGSDWNPSSPSDAEVIDCGGEAVLTHLSANALGLVEVVGQSAEPYALNGQYLIVRSPILGQEALGTLHGRPVIAVDTDGNTYFKRLYCVTGDQIVLESLDSSGDYGPVILSLPGGRTNCLEKVWPVVGVLFEKPN